MIKQTSHMRTAFSMLTAIFLIVLMSSVAAFVVNLSGKMVKETTLTFQREQAALYAKSYTEFALLAATSQNCIQGINDNRADGYTIRVDVQYIGNNLNGQQNCNTAGANPISTPNSIGGSIIVDTYVQYTNLDHPTPAVAPPITFHRRTLQRL